MTAADFEAERLAFRKQAEAANQGKKHGIFDHEEVDLSELMEDSQAIRNSSSVNAGARTTTMTKAPPPGNEGRQGKSAFGKGQVMSFPFLWQMLVCLYPLCRQWKP